MGGLTFVKAFFHCISAVLLLFAAQVFGQASSCTQENAHCVRVGQWDFSVGLGVGGRTNPIVGSDDIPIYLLPGISYYGEHFFWQTDTLGVTVLESVSSQFNIIGTISYDQSYFNDWGVANFAIEGGSVGNGVVDFDSAGADTSAGLTPTPLPTATPGPTGGANDGDERALQAGNIDLDRLHKRRMAGLVGFEYLYDHRYFSVGLQALADVTKVHNGLQVRAALSRQWQLDRQGIELTLGAEWKDADSLDYYYGVRASEVDDPQWAYTPNSDLSYYAKVDWRYRLSPHWELRGIVHHRRLGDEVSQSPIVAEDATTAAFIGGVYHF